MTRVPARGALDTTAASVENAWKADRRLYIVSLRFTEWEMRMLREAVDDENPTVTEVIRSRLFLRPVGAPVHR